MITPAFSPTATERILPRLALDFTTGVLDSRITLTRVLNTATVINSSGVIASVNADLPRFDYDPTTLVCKGLLIEETRANLLLNSLINGTNLSTQSVTLSAVSYALSFYGTGSIDISGGHVATVVGSGAYPARKTYVFTPTAGSTTFTVSGTVQYAQLEAGTFPTSFIPTAATSQTRNADVVSMTGTNFSSWYNAGEGAFAVGYDTAKPTALSNSFYAFSVSDNTLNNLIGIRVSSANAQYLAAVSGSVPVILSVAYTPNTSITACGAYKLDNYGYSMNKSNTSTDTSAGVPVVDRMFIGGLNGSSQIDGRIQYLRYYPQRVTNREVQSFA